MELVYVPQSHRGHKVFFFVFLAALWENLLPQNKLILILINLKQLNFKRTSFL